MIFIDHDKMLQMGFTCINFILLSFLIGYLENHHREGNHIGIVHVHQMPSLPAMGLYGRYINFLASHGHLKDLRLCFDDEFTVKT